MRARQGVSLVTKKGIKMNKMHQEYYSNILKNLQSKLDDAKMSLSSGCFRSELLRKLDRMHSYLNGSELRMILRMQRLHEKTIGCGETFFQRIMRSIQDF